MYLEDRTVSPVCYCNLHHSNWSGIKTAIEACFCLLSHHSTLFIDYPSFLFCFFTHFVEHVIVFLVPIIISRFCFLPSPGWIMNCPHVPTFVSWLATDPAAALGYSRTGAFPQPHPQLHPRLSRRCGGL